MPKLMFCDCRVIETVNLLRACISEWSSALSALTVSVLTTGGTGATAADDDVADEPSLADTSPSSPPPPSPTKLGSDDRRDEVAPLAEEEEEEDGSLGVLLLDLLSNAFCLIWVSIKSFES